jgi:ATP-dependent RNA helicase DeaD
MSEKLFNDSFVDSEAPAHSDITFDQLGLSSTTLQALKAKGFTKPTPIQALTIPILLKNEKDIVGQAQTGTGKTAAFALPLIDTLEGQSKTPKAIILTPTRELALQVSQEIESLKGSKRITILAVYGGQSIVTQFRDLKRGADIVVGTPGRILDHIQRETLYLDDITHVILDEADEMLNRGFLPDIQAILKCTHASRRTILFSATMSPEILKIAKQYMGEYELLKVTQNQLTCTSVEQIYFEIPFQDRFSALSRIIASENPFYGLIFCRTKRHTEQLARQLAECGYHADALNGDMSQSAREKILDKFKSKLITILVATDVAARGIDIKDVTHVINYCLPEEPEIYVHRIGRTGRAGKIGKAFSLVPPADRHRLTLIERTTKLKIQKGQLPSSEDIIAQKKETIFTELEKSLEKAPQEYYIKIASELLEKHPAQPLIALLLKRAFKSQLEQQDFSKMNIVEEPERRGGRRDSRRSEGRSERSGGGQRGFFNRKSNTKNSRGGSSESGFRKRRDFSNDASSNSSEGDFKKREYPNNRPSEGEFKKRPEYSNDRSSSSSEGGFKKREYSNNRPSEGGFRKRPEYSNDRSSSSSEGGFRKREYSNNRPSEGGFRKREYSNDRSSSSSEGGFKKRSNSSTGNSGYAGNSDSFKRRSSRP